MTHPSVNSIVERLEPCPFCGPGNSVVECYQDDYGGWRVGCGRCGSHSGFRPKSDPEARAKVIANWNKRPAESAAEIERLRREVEVANDFLKSQADAIEALTARALTAESAVADACALLTRYLKETPLGNQPHMIAGEVEEFLATRASAIRAAGAKKTAESGHSPSTHNSESE